MAPARQIVSGVEDEEAKAVEDVFTDTRNAKASFEKVLLKAELEAIGVNDIGDSRHDAYGTPVEFGVGDSYATNQNGNTPV